MSRSLFDAFISYSHSLDGRLAPTLQREVERFAKPWHRLRALRVFRDTASLTANPGLWSSIEQALTASRWFILLASPDAAQSPWVAREVGWWLAHRSPQRLLIVLTSGELVWDDAAGDFDWSATNALPPNLRGVLTEEPRWVDLRWLRDTALVDASNPRLRDSVADVAAAVREVPKDLLVNEHIREHRRTMRLAWGAVCGLVLLLVATAIAGAIALVQRESAQRQARVATARQLAAESIANLDGRFDLAQLLAVEADRMERDAQTRAALFQAASGSPHLVRVKPVGGRTTVLAGSADGRVVVGGSADGWLLRWAVDTNTVARVRAGSAALSHVAVDARGTRMVASDGATTYVWDGDPGQPPRAIRGRSVHGVGVSPSGGSVAILSDELILVDGSSGRELRRVDGPVGSFVTFPDEGTISVNGATGSWSRWSVPALTRIAGSDEQVTPFSRYDCCGFSPEGRFLAWAKYGDVNVYPQGPDGKLGQVLSVPLEDPDQFAVSVEGTVAVAGGGALYLAGGPERAGTPTVRRLPGAGGVTAVTFLGDGHRLVSAAGESLTLWDTTQLSRITAGPVFDAPDTANAGPPPGLAVSPDGRSLAVVSGGGDQVLVQDLTATPVKQTEVAASSLSDMIPLWTPDGELLLLGDAGAGHTAGRWTSGRLEGIWPPLAYPSRDKRPMVAGISPDGDTVVLVANDGTVQTRRTRDGAVTRTISFPAVEGVDGRPPTYIYGAAVSEDAATTAAVLPTGVVRVTDIDSEDSRELPGGPARAVAFAENRLLVARDDDRLELWSEGGEELIRSTSGDSRYEWTVAVDARAGLVARVTAQGTAVLSDLDTGQVLGSLTLPYPARSTGLAPWPATAITFIPDRQELVSATSSGSTVRWRLDRSGWVEAACRAAGRDLTADEWQRYVGTDAPADLACLR